MTKKITDLASLSSADPTDILPIVDVSANTTKKVTVDGLVAAGSVTPAKWTNPYRFSGYRSSGFSSANSTPTVINFNAESFDNNNNFDVTTNAGRYTVPVNGTYHFDARVGTSAANGFTTRIYIALYVNGTEVRRGLDTTVGSGNFMSATLSCDVQLTAAQYAEIYLFTSTISNMQGSAAETYFNGHYVG